MYIHAQHNIRIYCPISGYSEGLLAVDKRPMRVPLIVLSQKLGRAPKSLLPAGDLCQFHELLSLVCRIRSTTLPNRHTSPAILMVFSLLFCDGFLFVTRLMLLGYSRDKCGYCWGRRAKVMPRYSGVNFEVQLLSHGPSEMQVGEVNVIFAGDVKQKCMTSKVR